MEKLSTGKLLLHYITERRRTAGMFALCTLLFFFVCILYQLENLPKLLYGFYLCIFIVTCYGIYDFMKYSRHHEALYRAYRNVENMPDLLPPPSGLCESQYREIAAVLLAERRQMLLKAKLKETEMADYYTLWAHQIKTPISAMKLLLQNGEKAAGTDMESVGGNTEAGGRDAEGDRDVASALTEEIFKVEQYVGMVLYYLRLDSMSSDFLFRQYELRDIVNQAVKKYAVIFINSKLSLDMKDFSCRIATDEKWLLFVIEQIISNALKYTPAGSITIDADITPEQTQLIIEDTGIGIRPEDLPRIFERGFTGYNGRLDKKSTGIGLYLCKQILDKLSHTISVKSEVGKGTRVCIGFPDRTKL